MMDDIKASSMQVGDSAFGYGVVFVLCEIVT